MPSPEVPDISPSTRTASVQVLLEIGEEIERVERAKLVEVNLAQALHDFLVEGCEQRQLLGRGVAGRELFFDFFFVLLVPR